ncbi:MULTISPECIES: DUF1292 domain-containing protein [Ureibacillus]|jgi:uncharacterized protein YrzB (UPF0473 family)|uniref:UPF0473 protein HNR36_002632 n=1 Tax=Ureibacillus thermosphaericus TaxID=51173 RepID=A0A840Q027_URETH|nr:DUF1292 domain-containing protein [Ureibacillus thermosphaericus]MBB5150232.1 uncharacterized protein YrzB (UPF0473 family) [Ureibacillus thermosphaericus]NKZ32272.1 DUF1292 domain-containing protein [Ureibacillus thermosphaericus]
MVHEHDYEERHITVIDEDGNEQLCEVIHTFDSEKFGKSYVLYTIVGAEEDEDGQIEIFASSFTPAENGEDGELQPIETEEEWDMIEEVLNSLEEEFELEDDEE